MTRRLRRNPARIIARNLGVPMFVDAEDQWRSVRTGKIVANPNWDFYARPTKPGQCKKHGRVKIWKDTGKCCRCENRR